VFSPALPLFARRRRLGTDKSDQYQFRWNSLRVSFRPGLWIRIIYIILFYCVSIIYIHITFVYKQIRSYILYYIYIYLRNSRILHKFRRVRIFFTRRVTGYHYYIIIRARTPNDTMLRCTQPNNILYYPVLLSLV